MTRPTSPNNDETPLAGGVSSSVLGTADTLDSSGLPPTTLIGGDKCLRLAIDWLEWNATGALHDGLDELLKSSIGSIHNGWLVSYASGFWAYRLKDHDTGAVVLCNAKSAQIRLTGEPLTVLGSQAAYDAVIARLDTIGNYCHNSYPTRCDVAADTTGAIPLYPCRFETGRKGRRPRPTLHAHDADTGRYETLTLGNKGDGSNGLVVQVYNKTAELVASDKHGSDYSAQLAATWELNGWNGESQVTRLEVRSNRERLKSNGLTTDKILRYPYAVLSLGLQWVTPHGDDGTERLWTLAAGSGRAGEAEPLRAPTRRVGAPSSDGISRDYARVLARYMASQGITNVFDAQQQLAYALDCRTAAGELDMDSLVDRYSKEYRRGVTTYAPLDSSLSSPETPPSTLQVSDELLSIF